MAVKSVVCMGLCSVLAIATCSLDCQAAFARAGRSKVGPTLRAMKRVKRRPAGPKKDSPMRGFGGRLRSLREEQGLSQNQLADVIGIHLSQLSRIEREHSTPSAETLIALARALHTTTDALLIGDRQGEPKQPIRNVRLLERFLKLETIDRDEQETAIKLIDALVAKHDVEQALARRS